MNNVMSGGWSPYDCNISSEAKKVFDVALSKHLGTEFTPIAVATQSVAGTNYSFFCNSKTVAPNAPNEVAFVNIFQPLNGDPEYKIKSCDPHAVKEVV